MNLFITIIHIGVALSMVTLILLQSGKGGLGRSFGAGQTFHSKRGAERVVFMSTIVCAIFFLATSILTAIL